jgi:hypothetical protein
MCCKKNKSCKEQCRKIQIKRYFLPFLGVLALLPFDEIQDLVYYPIIIGFASIILFWNFTWIVYYTASKPLYYEDLFIDIKKLPNYDVDRNIKKRFKFILETVLILTNSILMGVLADVWLLRADKHAGIFSILGTTGGIIKIFQIVNNTISRIMLKLLRNFILKESEQALKVKRNKILELLPLKDKNTKNDIDEKKIVYDYSEKEIIEAFS